MRRATLAWVLVVAGCGATPDASVGDAAGSADSADAPPEEGVDGGADGGTDAPTVDAMDGAAVRDAPMGRGDGDGDGDGDGGRTDGGVEMDGPRDGGTVASLDGGGRCPAEMVLVNDRVCVDRWEAALQELGIDGGVGDWSPYLSVEGHRVRAVSRPDVVPQGYISGEQAAAACGLSGKRLCAVDEWLSACRGPMDRVYPYGNTYVHRRCNEGRAVHPVVQFYGTSVGVFTYDRMNNPGINMQADTVSHTGAFTDCVSTWGIYDMVGNMHEWVAASTGTFKGGFYVDAMINGHGCLYTTTAHAITYHDYSTGFRCCADPR